MQALRAVCVTAILVATTPARAQVETGRINLHLDLALAVGPAPSLGLVGTAGLDWQFWAPLALDLNVTGGHLGLFAGPGHEPGFFSATAGLRIRFIDRPGGDGYVVPRAGYLTNRTDDTSYAAVELEAGSEFTVDGPVRLGPFVRVAGGFGASDNLYYVLIGINLSTVILHRAPPPPEPKPERVLWTPREDDERDASGDDSDAPPPPPPPAPAASERVIVLQGITFALDSADIQPASEDALVRAAQLLRDNPSARVEIAGHTCDLGGDDYNLKLSQARAAAVADWLVAHGIDRGRLEVRGYGNTQPKVPNDSEEDRALNRRIEFRRLD